MKHEVLTFDFKGYRITGDYFPSTPDVFYMSNGDPGYPGEPEEFEVTKVEKDGVNIPLEVFFPTNEDECEELYFVLMDVAGSVYAKMQDEYWAEAAKDKKNMEEL